MLEFDTLGIISDLVKFIVKNDQQLSSPEEFHQLLVILEALDLIADANLCVEWTWSHRKIWTVSAADNFLEPLLDLPAVTSDGISTSLVQGD